MNTFKKLTDEEIKALDLNEQAIYQENLAAWEKSQADQDNQGDTNQVEDLSGMEYKELSALARERGYKFNQQIGKVKLLELMKKPPVADDPKSDDSKKADTKEVSGTNYLDQKEIEELQKANPTIKEFFVTADRVAFPSKWLAENHIKNAQLTEDIQVIK